jgi:poly(3-hydroxybutyrate) depolymerase
MYETSPSTFAWNAFMWPAMAAGSLSGAANFFARQCADLASWGDSFPPANEPCWATPSEVVLDLATVRLRNFSREHEGRATLVCAPYSLHGAAVVDFMPGHSLVSVLRDAGLGRLFATDWRSASEDMKYIGIDGYLADLNVLVDEIGPEVNLIGLCQGGWLALLYAARFPRKVRKLALAGAPIDIAAGNSGLTSLARSCPTAVFEEMVRYGDGRVIGRKMARFWGVDVVDASVLRQVLQTDDSLDSPEFARLMEGFEAWNRYTVDLPGTYFLEVVNKLYKNNELATNSMCALGRRVDLTSVRAPVFMLAARDDELVATEQLFALGGLVGSSPRNIRREIAPCRHLGLFMGKKALAEFWPEIARWIQ